MTTFTCPHRMASLMILFVAPLSLIFFNIGTIEVLQLLLFYREVKAIQDKTRYGVSTNSGLCLVGPQ